MSSTPPTRSTWSPILAAALIELRKMVAPRRILVLLFLLFVATAIGVASQAFGAVPQGDVVSDSWPERYITTAFLKAVVPLICLYVGASLWSEELESGTLVYIVTRPVPRPWVLLAKYSAAWLFLTVVIGVAAGAFGITMSVWRGHSVTGSILVTMMVPLVTAAWLAIHTLMGALFRRGLIAGIAAAGVLELVLGRLPTVARVLAPGHHVSSAVHALPSLDGVPAAEMMTGEPVNVWMAWVTLLALTATCLTLACLRVRYKEYAPTRTD